MNSLAILLVLGTASMACPAAPATYQGPWEQCGGINWTGSTSCAPGWTCLVQNPWYSQCLQADPSSPAGPPSAPSTVAVTPTLKATTTIPPVGVVSTSSPPVKVASTTTAGTSAPRTSTSSAPASTGLTLKASFTHYGAGDTFGSPNCNTNTAACAFYTFPGFSAAVSQNLYGVGPGAGAGPACGTCWKLTGETDSSGNKLSNAGTTIVVMVNNLCPIAGNPLCSMNTLSDTNQYGANVNFDLCSDSGAQAAFFGNNGVGLAVGTATQVDCAEWSGTIVH